MYIQIFGKFIPQGNAILKSNKTIITKKNNRKCIRV